MTLYSRITLISTPPTKPARANDWHRYRMELLTADGEVTWSDTMIGTIEQARAAVEKQKKQPARKE